MAENSEHQAPDSTKRIGRGMMYIAWVLALLVLTWLFKAYEEKRDNPNQNLSTSSAEGINEVVLKRNPYGHYVSSGTINGQAVTFLLDTGATNVSVPGKFAKRLNLDRLAQGQSSTANGYVDIYLTRIDEIRIGSIVAYDVRANINPGMNHSDQVLLGMSVLKNVEFTQRGDTLTLRQYQ